MCSAKGQRRSQGLCSKGDGSKGKKGVLGLMGGRGTRLTIHLIRLR